MHTTYGYLTDRDKLRVVFLFPKLGMIGGEAVFFGRNGGERLGRAAGERANSVET